MKKLFTMFLTLILLLVFTCSAVADVVIAPLVESAQILLFDTENVTLTGHADFFLNGERFKTADILYKQAGENSHWQLDLKTPRKYRKDQETGYTVIANDEKIYVMEKYYPGTYTTGSDAPNNTLIRQSTRANLLFSMLLSVADRIEALLPEDAVSVTRTDTYSEFCFTLSKDTTPAVMNTALNLTADFFLRRFMNVNYDSIGNWGQGLLEDYITVTEGILYSTDSFVLGDTSVTVTENVDTVAIQNKVFRLNVGKTEESYRFKYAEVDSGIYNAGEEDFKKINEATNLVRGSYSPYLAIYSDTGKLETGCLYNIY